MAVRKVKKYVIVRGEGAGDVVWALHADLSFTLTSLDPIDIASSETPRVDLRNYGEPVR